MYYRGTTPLHTFELPTEIFPIKTVKITYRQKDKEVLVKRTEDCTIEEGKITTRLSQEDTFRFEALTFVSMQLRVLTECGDALTSEPITISVGKCLDDEVLA